MTPPTELARGAPRALELNELPDELLARVLAHLTSTRDFGRADRVCRSWHAWRAGGSLVEQALRLRMETRGDAVPAAGASSMTQRLCWLELLRDARVASGLVSTNGRMAADVDAKGRLQMCGKLLDGCDDTELCSFDERTAMPTLQGTHVERVSIGGGGHVLVLTDAGDVLSFGSGQRGALGHGDRTDQHEPKVIEALRGVRVVAVAAGGYHSLVLTDEGEVLSFGYWAFGPLGHGKEEAQLVPKVIEALRGVRVVEIAAGYHHSMVLTDEGEVLTFGRAQYGQLGHGDRVHQREPKVIEALRGTRVAAIAAGGFHSLALTDEGEVLSFGGGWVGQLGQSDRESFWHTSYNDVHAPRPIDALRRRGVRVAAIAAGDTLSMVLTDDGAVLAFGGGHHGPIGHSGEGLNKYEPQPVGALGGVRVVAIAAGRARLMALTDEGAALSFHV